MIINSTSYIFSFSFLLLLSYLLRPWWLNELGSWITVAVASDTVYQLKPMVSGSPLGTPASSTTKTGRHDIAEILQKVALNTIKSNQISRK
jgi:hypothetical protein